MVYLWAICEKCNDVRHIKEVSLPFIGAEIETPTNAKINGTTSVLYNKTKKENSEKKETLN